jgi:hypothetical protein
LRFLDANATYQTTIYRDGPDANWNTNPQSYRIEKQTVTRNTVLDLRLAPGGGCAISLMKQ